MIDTLAPERIHLPDGDRLPVRVDALRAALAAHLAPATVSVRVGPDPRAPREVVLEVRGSTQAAVDDAAALYLDAARIAHTVEHADTRPDLSDEHARLRHAALVAWGCPRPERPHFFDAARASTRLAWELEHKPRVTDPAAKVFRCRCGGFVWGTASTIQPTTATPDRVLTGSRP